MDPEKRKKECMTKFDGVYMNEKSYDCAKLAVGSAIGNFLLQYKTWKSVSRTVIQATGTEKVEYDLCIGNHLKA